MNAQAQQIPPTAAPVAELEETRRVVAVPTSSPLLPRSFDQAVKLAEVMSKGKLVPAHLQQQVSDCLMVVEQAVRWHMSPFAVAQCTSSIHGKLMFEGKLVAAAIYTSGILVGRLTYDFTGSGESRAVKVTGKIRGSGREESIDVTLKDARTSNEHWKKQPDQQLVYASTRIWARRHAPEVMLGVYVPEELDVIDGEIVGQQQDQIDEKPFYDQVSFDKNMPAWTKLVVDGKKSPEQIIATVESKAALTDEQRKAITAIAPKTA